MGETHHRDFAKPPVGVDDDADGGEHLASTPRDLSEAQRIAILYRLNQTTRCSAGSDPLTSQSAEVGLGYLDCEECDEQEERGCQRFGNHYQTNLPNDSKWAIDYTGGYDHDHIDFCPRSVIDDAHQYEGRVSIESLLTAISKYRKVNACGGLAAFNGLSPADSPPRVSWLYATIDGVLSRYQAEVRDTQTQLQNAVVSAIARPRMNDDG